MAELKLTVTLNTSLPSLLENPNSPAFNIDAMSFVPDALIAPNLDAPRMRQAQADALSLGLMDARNHSLHVAQRVVDALGHCADPERASVAHAQLMQRMVGHGQRLGQWCPGSWASDTNTLHWPSIQAALLNAAEHVQDKLQSVAPTDEALAPFRASMELEDRLSQDLIRMANAYANAWAEADGSRAENAAQVWGTDWPAPHAVSQRQAIHCAASRWSLGSSAVASAALGGSAWSNDAGFVWSNELRGSLLNVPEYDIDAQPVSWAQFVEFVDDSGYDTPSCWTADGWNWVNQLGRRAPLHVEQLGVASGAVLQRSFGRLTRRAGTHAAMHLSWFEADAFARWAGRRLPTEHEWEIAAATTRSQGFRWGDVLEWTCSTYHDTAVQPGEYSPRRTANQPDGHFSLRGASFAARPRNKIVNARFHAAPQRDDGFFGFRTCSL